MPKQSENNTSPAFEQGFFIGTEALQNGTYCCKTALDAVKEEGYIINSVPAREFINGWRAAA